LGYFFHLLCDNLWSRRLGITYKRLYPELIDNLESKIWALKRDWYDLDFCYVRDHADCIFWRIIMTTPNPPPYLSFISYEGLTYSLDHIRAFYSTPDPERNLHHVYPYLNEATMNRYVEDTAALLLKLYNLLQTHPPLDGLNSALPLLDSAEMTPYEPPFGDPA